MENIDFNNHNFLFTYADANLKYYECISCNLIVFTDNLYEHTIPIISSKNGFKFKKNYIHLTCNEVLIKKLVE